jgi:cytidylate kinase
MYRAIALKAIGCGIDPSLTPGELTDMLEKTDVDFSGGRVILDGEDVTTSIRSPEVTAMASRCSALAPVREKLVALQRAMGAAKSVVMDGRDIGTTVFPNAEYKFFLTASADERARRRCAEMASSGERADYDEVLGAIKKRDYDDSHRALNPLQMADDAMLIDTDGIGIDEVTSEILSHIAHV